MLKYIISIKYKLTIRKNSSRINQTLHPIHRLFEFNNRIIQVSYGEHSLYLGGGQLSRIFYEFTYPSCVLALRAYPKSKRTTMYGNFY